MLAKSPGFTAVAVLSLALGIGANTAIFTLINGLMLKSLPVREPQQLLSFGKAIGGGTVDGVGGALDIFPYDFYTTDRAAAPALPGCLRVRQLPGHGQRAVERRGRAGKPGHQPSGFRELLPRAGRGAESWAERV